MKKQMLNQLEQVEMLASTSKLRRLLHHPIKYIYAIILKNFLYPIFRKEQLRQCCLFTGQKVNIFLPAATDIYLTGGKSHNSEIRLAKFLINNLSEGDTFWDIGAHYGYFSMLSSELVGKKGSVIAMEASPKTYSILKGNINSVSNVTAIHSAVSDDNKAISFYELPNLYSEYNTTDLTQFENEKWFSKIKPNKVNIDAITLDELMSRQKNMPVIIKIDVEGGEHLVVKGGQNLLKNTSNNIIVIIEYLEPNRHNQPHKEAADFLVQLGYSSYCIDKEGNLTHIENIEQHLLDQQLASDNIVFKR